jgi:hypothetical protein
MVDISKKEFHFSIFSVANINKRNEPPYNIGIIIITLYKVIYKNPFKIL